LHTSFTEAIFFKGFILFLAKMPSFVVSMLSEAAPSSIIFYLPFWALTLIMLHGILFLTCVEVICMRFWFLPCFTWSALVHSVWWASEEVSCWTVGSKGGSVVSIFSQTQFHQVLKKASIPDKPAAPLRCRAAQQIVTPFKALNITEITVYLYSFGFWWFGFLVARCLCVDVHLGGISAYVTRHLIALNGCPGVI